MTEDRKRSGLEAALQVWSRRKGLAFLVFSGSFTAAASYAMFLPASYQSTATVLIERQQVPEEFVRSTITGGLDARLQTISREVLSRSQLEDLITHFELYPDLRERAPLEKAVERMRRDIQLETKGVQQRGKGGAIITFSISYKGRDPHKVAEVTNSLAASYAEANLKRRERAAAGTAEFLRGQLEQVKQQLNERERRVREYKERHMGELPEQQRANLTTLERLTSALNLNSEKQARASERRAALANQFAEREESGPAAGPDATASRIAKLKGELAELRTRFTDKYPDVVRLKSEIASLERQLAEIAEMKTSREPRRETPALADPGVLRLKQEISALDAEIRKLKADEESLRNSIATYQRRVDNTPRLEQEFQTLSRDYTTISDLYRTVLRRYEEAELAETLEKRQQGEQFRILEPAIPSREPAPPKPLHLVLIALTLSLGLAAGAVVLAERLDTSFHTVDDLRASTALPVLVSIPRIVTEVDASRRRWRFRLAAAAAMLGLALIIGASYVVARGHIPPVGPLVRSLRLWV